MNKKLKWKLYEKRWDLRQIYFHTIIRRHICEKYFNLDPVMHYYARQLILSRIKTNCWIRDKILSGEPFMVARFGNTELSVMNREQLELWFSRLNDSAGFFPADIELAFEFCDRMLEACSQVDPLAM